MDTKWESVGGMNWEIGIDMYILLWGFPGGGVVKNLPANAGNAEDTGLIPGLGQSLGERNGYPFQYSCLENSMDCIVHGATKSRTGLSDFHFDV